MTYASIELNAACAEVVEKAYFVCIYHQETHPDYARPTKE